MKDKLYFWASIVIGVIAIVLFIMLYTSCMTAPDREDFQTESGYAQAYCNYALKDHPDKSSCSKLIEAYCSDLKLDTRRDILEYCQKNKFQGMTENECRLFLNQK